MAEKENKELTFQSEQIEEMAECLKALASPMRLKILLSIKDTAKCVSDIGKDLGVSHMTLSQHLNMLRHKKIVTRTRRGNRIFYAISSESVKKFLELLPEIACFEA